MESLIPATARRASHRTFFNRQVSQAIRAMRLVADGEGWENCRTYSGSMLPSSIPGRYIMPSNFSLLLFVYFFLSLPRRSRQSMGGRKEKGDGKLLNVDARISTPEILKVPLHSSLLRVRKLLAQNLATPGPRQPIVLSPTVPELSTSGIPNRIDPTDLT
jgi:hypothetical protein